MKIRGFTAVELLVTITIMAILLTLAVVNVRSTQVNARDSERSADVENIGLALEGFYAMDHSSFTKVYPGTLDFTSTYVMTYIKEHVHENSLRAPGVEPSDPISLIVATNNSTTPASVTPAPTTKTYVYQPLTSSGALCSILDSPCRRFNIYYQLEKATSNCPAPQKICTYKSKNR